MRGPTASVESAREHPPRHPDDVGSMPGRSRRQLSHRGTSDRNRDYCALLIGFSPGGGRSLDVTFYGVRGSTPCSCEDNRRYGGNTACVAIDIPGSEPIVLDLGTGLRFWGQDLPVDAPFHGHALVTHL